MIAEGAVTRENSKEWFKYLRAYMRMDEDCMLSMHRDAETMENGSRVRYFYVRRNPSGTTPPVPWLSSSTSKSESSKVLEVPEVPKIRESKELSLPKRVVPLGLQRSSVDHVSSRLFDFLIRECPLVWTSQVELSRLFSPLAPGATRLDRIFAQLRDPKNVAFYQHVGYVDAPDTFSRTLIMGVVRHPVTGMCPRYFFIRNPQSGTRMELPALPEYVFKPIRHRAIATRSKSTLGQKRPREAETPREESKQSEPAKNGGHTLTLAEQFQAQANILLDKAKGAAWVSSKFNHDEPSAAKVLKTLGEAVKEGLDLSEGFLDGVVASFEAACDC
jgi:hypothetical protein